VSRLEVALALLAAAACGGADPVDATGAGGGTTTTTTGGSGGHASGGGGEATAGAGGAPVPPPEPVIETISERHRAIPGQMFGGWGPHLGHLVRAAASDGSGETLWFVDDYCAPGACDVLHDHTLGYFERTGEGWVERATSALAGVQQNTATIVAPNGELQSYGIDVDAHTIRVCRYDPLTGPKGCAGTLLSLGPAANYIGAAVSPAGYRMVWWTEVAEPGGTFHWAVNYGGGWNGPRSGGVGGYNDASYISIAFGGGDPDRFTMHAEMVAGVAPSWTFVAGVGSGDAGSANAAVFSTPFGGGGDPAITTNDVWIDPASDDTHLVARSQSGAAVYYHRAGAGGGGWSAPLFSLPATLRARFVASGTRIALVYGPNAGGLAYRVADAAERPAGMPIDWASLPETQVELPGGFGSVLAIYPESTTYQTAAPGFHVAVVGDGAENLAIHVSLEGE
jgi:hypothetical protein